MSNVNVNHEFADFGKRWLGLGIIYIFLFILFLLSLISFLSINLVLVFGILSLGVLILNMLLLFSTLGHIKVVGIAHNNELLRTYQSRLKVAFILFLVGYIFFLISLLANRGFRILFFILAIIFNITAKFIEYHGWDRLNSFFRIYKSKFPPNINYKARTFVFKLAAILDIFIVTMIVGYILRIVGSFSLTKLKELKDANVITLKGSADRPIAPLIPAQSVKADVKRVCENCGAALSDNEEVCSYCGSEI